MKDLSSDNQADVIKAFNSTSRYLDDLLNIDNPYFVITRPTLLRHSTQRLDIKTIFLTLAILIFKEWSTKFIHLNCNLIKLILQKPRPPFWIYICLFLTALFHPKFMINVMTLILIYIVNFPFLDGDVPRRPSNRVYISQLIRFARVCSHTAGNHVIHNIYHVDKMSTIHGHFRRA